MTLTYSDLKVSMLNLQYQKGILSRFKSFIASKMIKENNPEHDILRIGQIKFTRDPQKNFLSYVSNLIISGMKSSVGLQNEKMKKKIANDSAKGK